MNQEDMKQAVAEAALAHIRPNLDDDTVLGIGIAGLCQWIKKLHRLYKILRLKSRDTTGIIWII